jgi:hypothetical protein
MTSFSAGNVYTSEGPWTALYPHFEGLATSPSSEGLKPGLGVMWGLLRNMPELIAESIEKGQPWVYLDHGYFKRGHYSGYYRMTLNDFQQRQIVERPPDRWAALKVEMKPWRRGKRVVVCPPSKHVCKLFNLEDWEANTLEALKTKTDRPITVRRKDGTDSFTEAISDAHCVVTVNSIAAVEAVLNGVPVFVSPISCAAPVGRTDLEIEDPLYPDREPWAWSLAYGQYRKEEFNEGLRNITNGHFG